MNARSGGAGQRVDFTMGLSIDLGHVRLVTEASDDAANAMNTGFHGVRTHWTPGFMAFGRRGVRPELAATVPELAVAAAMARRSWPPWRRICRSWLPWLAVARRSWPAASPGRDVAGQLGGR
jgi:hypothetical protein